MSAVQAWAKDKPQFLAILAHGAAFNASPTYDLVRSIYSAAGWLPGVRLAAPAEWASFYSRPKQVAQVASNQFAGLWGSILPHGILGLIQKHKQHIAQHQQQMAKVIEAKSKGDMRAAVKVARELVANDAAEFFRREAPHLFALDAAKHIDAAVTDETMEAVGPPAPETLFFFRVSASCWWQYGETLTAKLRRARRSPRFGLQDLVDLVVLDGRVIHDRGIARVLHRADSSPVSREIWNIVHGALTRKRKWVPSRGRFKATIGAYISRLSEFMGRRLSAAELRQLFDAIARDKGDLRDFDLPESDAAWEKNIQRDRDFWKLPMLSDKELLERVRMEFGIAC